MKSRNGILVLVVMFVLACPFANAFAGAFADAAVALENEIATMQSTIAAQQAQIVELQTQVATLSQQSNNLLALGNYVRVDENPINGLAGPHVIFEGVNLHVRNGLGKTLGVGVNGLGNLIVGYNEAPDVLLEGERAGSHNFIMGRAHKYLSNASILHGWASEARAHSIALIAADGTVANSSYSAAIGGMNNVINAGHGVTIGGENNTVGDVLGSGAYHAVAVGGAFNTVTGDQATVTGGFENVATGNFSSVSGGNGVSAVNDYSWAAGTLSE